MAESKQEKLDKLNKKIAVLQARKNKMIAIENNKQRKLLVKQKILIGGYVLNSLHKKPINEQIEFFKKVKSTLEEKRKSDLFAIECLIETTDAAIKNQTAVAFGINGVSLINYFFVLRLLNFLLSYSVPP